MLGSIIDIFFPPVCPACEKAVVERGAVLCRGCSEGFSALRITGPACGVCGEPFASKASGGHTCGRCLAEPPPFIGAAGAYQYSGCVLDAIHAFKYNGRVILAPALGALLSDAAGSFPMPDVIIPVPLHSERLRKRGFNQSLLIARRLAKTLKTGLSYGNLARVRPTAAQVSLDAPGRARNVAGAFAVPDPAAVEGKTVFLIDDVYTTGATVRECSKVLKKAGARVYALTLARAVKL